MRALGAAMLCVGLLSSASIAMTTQDPAPAKDPEKKATKTTTISGTVAAVTDSTVTVVDSKKAEHTLTITADTKVTKAGKDATLADVKANDVVAVEATKGEGDIWTALKIAVS